MKITTIKADVNKQKEQVNNRKRRATKRNTKPGIQRKQKTTTNQKPAENKTNENKRKTEETQTGNANITKTTNA